VIKNRPLGNQSRRLTNPGTTVPINKWSASNLEHADMIIPSQRAVQNLILLLDFIYSSNKIEIQASQLCRR
jgi:hypothetical protein